MYPVSLFHCSVCLLVALGISFLSLHTQFFASHWAEICSSHLGPEVLFQVHWLLVQFLSLWCATDVPVFLLGASRELSSVLRAFLTLGELLR